MCNVPQGFINEYYDTMRLALCIDWGREPSHEEVLDKIADIWRNNVKD